ncbi:MAG: alanine--tRNA ligase, partial [Elusimicrobiota bacterium]|nr:alanine--tRNA ligase [Elusimicrobiota bacterium]
IKDFKEVQELKEGESGGIVLSQTSFYAESGGQIADKGNIIGDSFSAQVEAVFKPIGSLFVHKVKVLKGSVIKEKIVKTSIDKERRLQIARHHTSTHLLQKVLREILGEHITQAGSLVSNEYLRFDFTHFAQIKKEDLIKIERKINSAIRANMPVHIQDMKIDEARAAGAMALFGEKYGDIVRTVSVKDEVLGNNYSMELCGGIHVSRSGDIGLFKIVSESSIGAGVRRIEAVVGEAAEKFVLQEQERISKISALLNSSNLDVLEKVQKQISDIKELEADIESLKSRLISQDIDTYVKNAKDINGFQFLPLLVKDIDIKALRDLSDKLKEKLGSAVLLIISESKEKSSFIVSVSQDYVNKGLNAGKIAKSFAADINGSGGGKPDFAQGGTKETAQIISALADAHKHVKI